MWDEKYLKIMPALLFLFCLLEIFEIVLTIGNIGNIEKLEAKIGNNLKESKNITILLNELENMSLEHFKDKKIKIK